jgi:ABC-type dipeptide/oligopeptide/nickel transport system permease component
MLGFLLQRAAQAVVVLILVSVAAFALVLLTGDPVALMLPTHASEEDRTTLRRELGLDRPVPVQYLDFLARAVVGDLGQSVRFNQPVARLILGKLPSTLALAATAIGLAVAIGVPLGLVAGSRPHSPVDAAGTVAALLGVSVPTFWIGLLFILVVGDYLRWLPVGGGGDLRHLVMPALTLAIPSAGLITRLTRASVAAERAQAYVVTARAKGLPPARINGKHVLRNALIPTVTVVGLQFGALVGGSVIVESVFAWPGVGWLLMQGVFARDLPLVRAIVLILAATFVLLNLLVDLSYRYLDPRIRLQP